MIRVLLADDHEIVRLGLRAILDDAEDIEVVGEVATAEAAISAAHAGGIDVLLMDLRFGAGAEGHRVTGGAEATRMIKTSVPHPPTVTATTATAAARRAAGAHSATPSTAPISPHRR